jgi:NADP-dependent 3-hydroxy acid dehydrogenase YdfG
MDLSDSVAVVTGASSGVGEATARALAGEGCAVVLAARREDRLDAVAGDLEDARTLVAPTDVTDEDSIDATVDAAEDAFGGIDVLVNNAGVLHEDRVVDADRADFREQIEVNLLGTMNVTHAALPSLLESGGDVVAVSSTNAERPAPGGSAYTASKFGVNGFCKALRKELSGEAVRVSVVMPGPVQSEMNDWSEWDARPLAPGDVADAIADVVSRPDHVETPEVVVDAADEFGAGD